MSVGHPFPYTAQNWHKNWFSRDASNTKVVCICMANKMAYILTRLAGEIFFPIAKYELGIKTEYV